MKIIIIGQTVVDIIEEGNSKVTKPGGIYYSTLGALQIGKFIDEIYLITNYSLKHKELFGSVFDKVNLTLSKSGRNIPTVNLKIYKDKERDEKYSLITQKIKLPLEISLNKYDGILVNMISGFEITIGHLEIIRKYYFGPIYLDIHSLSRGIDENNNRKFRQIPSVKRWLDCADIVQCNESELLTICESNVEQEIVNFVFRRRPRLFIITRANRGATLYTDFADRDKEKFDVVPIKVTAKNSVGCGDIFGATFLSYYADYDRRNIHKILRYANIAAGLFTQYRTIEDFGKLGEDFTKYNA
ncbi:MAG: PfkB family carbohydrate kinase [Melioribacteraceae bacterium]